MTEITRNNCDKKTKNNITTDQVLSWTKAVEAQRTQKAIIYTMKDSREFDMVKKTKQGCDNTRNPQKYKKKPLQIVKVQNGCHSC